MIAGNMTTSVLSIYATAAAGSLILAQYLWKRWNTLHKLNLPPSPKGYPIVGNVFSLPSELEHLAYMELGQELKSDIILLKMFDFNLVVLNSAEAASDLLEKRSGIYSDRTCPNMVKDPTLFDWSRHMSLLGYNDLWRSHRRMMNNWLNVRASSQFHDSQERQARVLLSRLLPVSELSHPFGPVMKEYYRSMAASIFQTTYGYHIDSTDDKFFAGTREALNNLFKASMRTNFLVNTFPVLSYVPDWMPGTQWKRVAREWKAQKDWVVDSVYQWAKDQFAGGTAEPSILSSLFGHEVVSQWSGEEADSHLKEMAIIICAGALDPPSNTLVKFTAAMVLNPQVQEKAQKEIDAVTGQNRLPTMSDRDRMPYVQNLILEVMRWHPVLPMALPHVCFKDDVYRGYDIPKGTVLMGNLWAMSRDENVYKDAETFNPDRFLDSNVPPLPIFGWGRRKCPGNHYGEASIFIAVASLLATYTFTPKRDGNGQEIPPNIEAAGNSLALCVSKYLQIRMEN
ncbi:hypothetical protein FRC12_005539 [Ceratobasidium sp. 428]|nr:hypothetical protein FRC12_005539 [Ceratobasidium sp. 428]